MICVVVMTDGRSYIQQSIESLEVELLGPISRKVIHDDSGDELHRG